MNQSQVMKRIAYIVGATFAILAVVVAVTVVSNKTRRALNDRLYQVDRLLIADNLPDATTQLRGLLHDGAAEALNDEVNERIVTAINKAEQYASNRPTDAITVYEAFKDEGRVTDETRYRLETLGASIQDDLKDIRDREEAREQRLQRDNVRQLKADEARREARAMERERLATKRQTEREATRAERLAAVGGSFIGLLTALGLVITACILAGFGEIIVAFRDVAINTYLMVRPSSEATSTARTVVPAGHNAPAYAFIPVIAWMFYFAATVEFLAAMGIVVLLISAWTI